MDPIDVLGVSSDATDEEIRAAYLSKVQEHPPDRSPERFELIRDAYEVLRDPRRRLQQQLFAADPLASFAALLDPQRASRRFAGPNAWRDVLRGK